MKLDPRTVPTLSTLGRLRLTTTEGDLLPPDSKPLILAAYLARLRGFRSLKSDVAMLLWPDASPENRMRSLRQAVHVLRKASPERPLVEGVGESLHLDPAAADVDVWALERAVELEDYRAATELGDGRFLESVEGKMGPALTRWAEAEDVRLEILLDTAYQERIQEARALGDRADAVECAQRWRTLNPLQERRTEVLVGVLVEAGRPVEALQEAEHFRALIALELDAEPSESFETLLAQTREAVESTIQGRPELSVPEASPPPPAHVGRPSQTARRVFGAVAVVTLTAVLSLVAAQWIEQDTRGVSVPALRANAYGELRLTPTDVVFQEMERDGSSPVWSPVGREYADHVPGTGGIDVALVGADGSRSVILDSAADELALDWSPDGQQLLYSAGRYDPEAERYDVRVGLWARKTWERFEFDVPGWDGRLRANWSPLGLRLAIGGGPRLLITTTDGQILRDVEPEGFVGPPAWSPDGRRVAVPVWENGPADLFVLEAEADEGHLRRVARTSSHEIQASWLTNRYLLAVSRGRVGHELLLIDAEGGGAVLLTDASPVDALSQLELVRTVRQNADETLKRIFATRTAMSRPTFVDTLLVSGPPGPLSVGEFALYRGEPLDSSGTRLVNAITDPVWTTRNGRLELLHGGLVRAREEGADTILVEYSQWRDAKFPVDIRRPRQAALQPAFTETWEDGWEDRWIAFGEPLPSVVPLSPQAPGRQGFHSNGDQNYRSGAVSEQRFATSRGVTIEFWSRSPFTSELFQVWEVGLIQGFAAHMAADPRFGAGSGGQAWVAVGSQDSRLVVPGMDPRFRIPLPDSLDRWRRYALQVAPTGEQRLIVDGLVHYRWPASPDWAPADSAQVVLSGMSVGTQIVHGTLAVYQGEVYRIDPSR